MPTRLCICLLRLLSPIVVAACVVASAPAQTKRQPFIPGARAVVFDERISALRERPDIKAPLKQRLRRGRAVGVLNAARHRDGARFLFVAVSRNTRGWVLAEAVVRSNHAADAARLLKLIEESDDDFIKARLTRLCADEFRAAAPRALLLLGQAAERAADRLTRDAKRRVDVEEAGTALSKRDYLLNYVGLDRYNRIGVTFDYDAAADRIVYDGAAYRELARRYPRSAEAAEARRKIK